MSDVYLIKKETLTAIADQIREKAPINWGGFSITPNDMAYTAIYDVYDEGDSNGYKRALNNLSAPLVLQARATPTYDSNFKDRIFTSNIFNGDVGGVRYYLNDFIDYDVMDSQSTFCVEFYNNTNRYVIVYFWVYGYDYGRETDNFTKYIAIPIAPNSSGEFETTSDFAQPAWDYEIKGAVFK